MKMDEEDGAGKKTDLDPRVRGFLSDRDARTVDRRGGVFADRGGACLCVHVCVCVRAYRRMEEERERERIDVRRAMAERSESGRCF